MSDDNWEEFIKKVKKNQNNNYDENIETFKLTEQKISKKKQILNNVKSFCDEQKNDIKEKNYFVDSLNNITKNKIRKMHNIPLDGKIDLHGLTLEKAENIFIEFIMKHYFSSSKKVLVITGKGKFDDKSLDFTGKIKSNITKWINNNSKYIKSCANAPENLGGDGAILLFIRQK